MQYGLCHVRVRLIKHTALALATEYVIRPKDAETIRQTCKNKYTNGQRQTDKQTANSQVGMQGERQKVGNYHITSYFAACRYK